MLLSEEMSSTVEKLETRVMGAVANHSAPGPTYLSFRWEAAVSLHSNRCQTVVKPLSDAGLLVAAVFIGLVLFNSKDKTMSCYNQGL